MPELFKGYIPIANKKAKMPFKGRDGSALLTLEQARKYGDYAGVLNTNTVLIDIDDAGQAEVFMNIVEETQAACRVYHTTRGMHFLFYNDGKIATCKTDTKLACGLHADIKIGTRSTYEVLRNEGIDREIIYDIFDDEDYESVPVWALPVRTKVDLLALKEGDGRNQALFNYILTLQQYSFSKPDIRKTLQLSNRYVLDEPLDENELDVIMRDEAFQKDIFFERNQFLFDKFAKYMKSEHYIKRINGQLHIYQDGVYVDGYRALEAAMVSHIPTLARSKRQEVLAYLEILCPVSERESSANLIAFENGIYDIETEEFSEFSPEVVITNKIRWNYNPKASCELVDRVFDKVSCNIEEIRALLEEAIGYTFYRRASLRKAFILIGDKRNGKSTFLDMLVNLLGHENTSALDLNELGDRFKTAELLNKLANIGDDIEDDFIPNPAMFKKLTAGDRVNAERKGQDPFDFNNYAKLIFSANELPRIRDKTGAVLDRLVIIPFEAKFSDTDPDFDPLIKYKLRSSEAMEYLIQIGLKALCGLLEKRSFTVSDKVQAELEEYSKSNNPILLFFQDKDTDFFLNHSTNHCFRKYQEFCLRDEYKPMSASQFSRQVKKFYGLDIADKRIQGEKCRVFTYAS